MGSLTENIISILLGNGDGTFQNETKYKTGHYPTSITEGDFNHDMKRDLAVANIEDNTISVLLGNGDGTFRNQTTHPTGNRPSSIISSDFNNDMKLDLVVDKQP